jgi:hypothetical protein
MVAIGRDREDLIAFAFGQELMLALRHADSVHKRSSVPMDSEE